MLFVNTGFSADSCLVGYYNGEVNSDTFVVSETGTCPSGYELYERTDYDIYPVGAEAEIAGTETDELCADGQYMVNGACVNYTQGDCPDDFYNVTLSKDIFVSQTNGTCPSGYEKYEMPEIPCDSFEADITDKTKACVLMCDEGIYTETGICANLCKKGITTLNIQNSDNNIYKFPVFDTKPTEHVIGLAVGDGACYVGLQEGEQKTLCKFVFPMKKYIIL